MTRGTKGSVQGRHVLHRVLFKVKKRHAPPYQLLFKCRAVNAKKGNYHTIEEGEWCLLSEGGKVKEKGKRWECSNSEFAKLAHHPAYYLSSIQVL